MTKLLKRKNNILGYFNEAVSFSSSLKFTLKIVINLRVLRF